MSEHPLRVTGHSLAEETVTFTLPRRVRTKAEAS
jgi:hypothetical protein